LVDERSSVVDPSSSGVRAAYGIAARPIDPAVVPVTCPGLPACTLGDFTPFFVTSRVSSRVSQVIARGADRCRPGLPGDPCGLDRTMSVRGGQTLQPDSFLNPSVQSFGDDIRDVKFNRDGTRAYVVNRRPPAVIEIDTQPVPPPAGDPRGLALQAIEVCPEP